MRCKNCRNKFEPKQFLQKFCRSNDECKTAEGLHNLEQIKKKENKDWGERKKEMKKGLKRKQDYEKDLEKIFNEFIRERDKNEPCISCDAPKGTYKLTAGHYFPAGHNKNVRFDEDNLHSQCWFNCNSNRHGNLAEYLPRLIKKIGQKRFDELTERKNTPRRYTIPELIEMKVIYKDKLKALKQRK